VRVVTLRVRPKDFGLPRIVERCTWTPRPRSGTHGVQLTPHSYLDAELEDVSIVLDNALWERRYWLPYRQEIEIRRRATWLDVPVRGIIRARWEDRRLCANLGLANSWFRGRRDHVPAKAERDPSPGRSRSAPRSRTSAEAVRQNDLERVARGSGADRRPARPHGLKGRRSACGAVSDLLPREPGRGARGGRRGRGARAAASGASCAAGAS